MAGWGAVAGVPLLPILLPTEYDTSFQGIPPNPPSPLLLFSPGNSTAFVLYSIPLINLMCAALPNTEACLACLACRTDASHYTHPDFLLVPNLSGYPFPFPPGANPIHAQVVIHLQSPLWSPRSSTLETAEVILSLCTQIDRAVRRRNLAVSNLSDALLLSASQCAWQSKT